jgi:hypothetical protein
MEVRINLTPQNQNPQSTINYRWLSETVDLDDAQSWQNINLNPLTHVYRFPFRQANTLAGELCIQPGTWPDATIDSTDIDAALA